MDNAAKAELFQRLHLGPEILVIANAWDAASARVFEQAGKVLADRTPDAFFGDPEIVAAIVGRRVGKRVAHT